MFHFHLCMMSTEMLFFALVLVQFYNGNFFSLLISCTEFPLS